MFRLFAKRPPSGLSLATPADSSADGSSLKSPAASVRRARDELTPAEYKMSVVNDSGVYLPPSPVDDDEATFWGGRSPMKHHARSLVDENEPFCLSRESFDSYRRSFDISARSPIHSDSTTRTSLDSRLDSRLPRYARPTNLRTSLEVPEEDKFEDIGLDDGKDAAAAVTTNGTGSGNGGGGGMGFVTGLTGGRLSAFMHSRGQGHGNQDPHPDQTADQPSARTKRSFFSRFSTTNGSTDRINESSENLAEQPSGADKETSTSSSSREGLLPSAIAALLPGTSSTPTAAPANRDSPSQPSRTTSSHLSFHFGRRRAQSNASTAQELGDMPRPARETESSSEADGNGGAEISKGSA
ncbi:hypothetical protein KEM52_006736 [Ascosphaera acerosa]|nr:hypothetical protein KEM52_006736 [Ascosphaera acerosa]